MLKLNKRIHFEMLMPNIAHLKVFLNFKSIMLHIFRPRNVHVPKKSPLVTYIMSIPSRVTYIMSIPSRVTYIVTSVQFIVKLYLVVEHEIFSAFIILHVETYEFWIRNGIPVHERWDKNKIRKIVHCLHTRGFFMVCKMNRRTTLHAFKHC